MLKAKFEVVKVTRVTEEEKNEYTEYLLFPVSDDVKLTKEKKFVIKPGKLRLRMYGPIEEDEGLELGQRVHFGITRVDAPVENVRVKPDVITVDVEAFMKA